MINKYIKYLKNNHYSINTINTYYSVLNKYKGSLDDIRILRNKIKNHFDSPNTAWLHYNTLCSYFTWSKNKKIEQLKKLKLPQIPMKYMLVFKKDYLIKKTNINENDSSQLINKKLIVRFLFETGLRACELNEISLVNKKIIIVNGKGNKKRQVFHNNEITKKIINLNISTKTLRLWVKQILGKNFTPHSIRRSHATHLLLKGANPKMVMMQLGHSKVETTFRYLQLSMETNKKIYDKYF